MQPPQQASQGQNQPTSTVVINSGNIEGRQNFYEHYPSRGSTFLGCTLIVIGILMIFLNIVSLTSRVWLAEVSQGFWCGTWFILTGAFGIWASKVKTLWPILVFMLLSIIAPIIGLVSLSFSIVSAVCDNQFTCVSYDDDRQHGSWRSRVALSVTQACFAGLGGVCGIVASALCCSAICCGRRGTSGVVLAPSGNVQYVSGSGQPVQHVTYVAQPGMMQTGGATCSTVPITTRGLSDEPPPYYPNVAEEKEALTC